MFFGTVEGDNKKVYDLTRTVKNSMDADEQDFDSSTRSNSNRVSHCPPRCFKSQATLQDTQLLSPPKTLIELAQRRSISSSTCPSPVNKPLSPPRNLVESAHKRSISKSTCSLEKIAPRRNVTNGGWSKEEEGRA
ncbi:hypothetical protein SLEP1_g13239 [Rubroshorea leprosula]|uniref:Uncharacterized protein n=1 Tax=Rubroshorea leprosula TaxID=152421 RepID=A0AAV5IP37_9ROSI|nr:hypothetical protein SLEP1_g13239 [Rubroshorea leprosula]